MIWIPHDKFQADGIAPLAAHVRGVIEEHCVGVPGLDDFQVEELAAAIAEHVGGSGDSGMYVESGYLVMLASRALFSIGARKAAHRILVFGAGLVHPSEWTFHGGQSVWTLDLGRMSLRTGATLELVFFSSLNIVLDCVAEVWDASSGRGALGLRHAGAAAAGILRRGRGPRLAALTDEISDACRAKLRQIGKAHGWLHTPELLIMDR